MEQVRPLSWDTQLCSLASEVWLFSVPTKTFGLSYYSPIFSYSQANASICNYFYNQQDKKAGIADKYAEVQPDWRANIHWHSLLGSQIFSGNKQVLVTE